MEDARRAWVSILIYLVLTLSISSIWYYKIIQAHSLSGGHGLWVLGLMWSPGLAGLLTRFLFQRNLRGHGWGWGPWKYQIASWWIPIAYASVIYLPLWFLGYGKFHPGAPAPLGATHWASWRYVLGDFLLIATAGFLFSCLSAAGEELGWRGYLVPQLAKVTSFRNTALLSGIIWSLWHYPVLIYADYHGQGPMWYSLLCFTVMVVGISFLFAWMRLKSGSVWTGVFLHASHNAIIQAYYDQGTAPSRVATWLTSEFGAGLAVMGILLAILFYKKRGELPQV